MVALAMGFPSWSFTTPLIPRCTCQGQTVSVLKVNIIPTASCVSTL
uniref:Uncharacterized protein n=1 Tax=Anguilla anguilla TaxID=7936 RepID=A0A0E9SJZ6_ANGAN